MNIVSLAFFLLIFAMFITFITYILHRLILLYYPQTTYAAGFRSGLYPLLRRTFYLLLPKNYTCKVVAGPAPKIPWCKYSVLADICIINTKSGSIPAANCTVLLYNLDPATLSLLREEHIELANISGVLFAVVNHHLVLVANFSALPLRTLHHLINDFYFATYAISIYQYYYFLQHSENIGKRLYLAAEMVLGAAPCLKYIDARKGLQVKIVFSNFSCNSSYVQQVLVGATKYIKQLENFDKDTYIYDYLFPLPGEEYNLPLLLQSYFYQKFSSCAAIENVELNYSFAAVGNCRQACWHCYFAARVPGAPVLVTYSQTVKAGKLVLEANYTLPVIYYTVAVC
ncbi:MAG: hypothetical protein GXO42_02925 [bacterium]|nr:hypothetical protein [bacterium]